jgi:hypothetical protein
MIGTVVLAYETEASCATRLRHRGLAPERADEVASYLAQATDLAPRLRAHRGGGKGPRHRLRGCGAPRGRGPAAAP